MAKSFEELFEELSSKIESGDESSRTVEEFNRGTHFIGKKIVEEAAEVWMASEFEGKKAATEEISQLLYHLQVMMIKQGISLDEIYEVL